MPPSPPGRSTRIAPTAPLQALPYDSLGMDAESFKRGVLGHLEYTLAELPHQVDSEWEPYVAVALAVRDRMVERWVRTQDAYYRRDAKRPHYVPGDVYRSEPELARALDMIGAGAFSPGKPDRFRPIVESLLTGGDHYFLLADYAAYLAAQERVARAYRDEAGWTRRSILNVAHMGKFSSDRTIRQYAEEVWRVDPVKVE